MHGAGLHRFVVPEDRVRPDPALPVIDERALVVRAQQDEGPVEREKVVLTEPFDLTVGDGGAVADHAAEAGLGKHLGHRAANLAVARRSGGCDPGQDRGRRVRVRGRRPGDS